jgi:glutamine amidotransferase-like uncharacterized protein
MSPRIGAAFFTILIPIVFCSCGVRRSGELAPILLFDGKGTSPNDVAAVEQILHDHQLHYTKVESSWLNDMEEARLRGSRLLIIPGGNFIKIGNGLTADTTAKIRRAVEHGLNYLGICAGGFFAGNTGYNSLNLTSGVRFAFYSAETQGIRKAAVAIAANGEPTLDHYWEDGPQFTGWGSVVARYPDGTPAVVEGNLGTGWVVLSGIHPEAPESWRHGMNFRTPAGVDHAYAVKLILAALNRKPLSNH